MKRIGAWLCRHGMHKWGIVTVPINVRWCERCGKRDPEETTAEEVFIKHLLRRLDGEAS